ncbi:hypothetical protein CPC16_002026 [Podila verticillata]|nr:hypothetical protein BGZ52_002840 [Haplosporangium bisporale]KAF9373100.1 hypothetical protein CPC16_002026 [Podila verticillata]
MTHTSLTLQSTRLLGSGAKIPLLGFGTYLLEPGKQAEETVLWALHSGYRHIDTATFYRNEVSVGNAIRQSGIPREDIFVTTKLFNNDHGYDKAIAAANLSLEKLGLEYVDLYLIHSPQPGPELRAESWKALETLVEQGKVKNIGVSNYSVAHLKELLASNPRIKPAVNQVEIHPWLARKDIVKFSTEHDIVIEAYSPLSRGHRLQDPTVIKVGEKYNKSAAQVLIRWSLQHGNVVIPKSSDKERIVQNADVFNFELSEDDMRILDNLNDNYVSDYHLFTVDAKGVFSVVAVLNKMTLGLRITPTTSNSSTNLSGETGPVAGLWNIISMRKLDWLDGDMSDWCASLFNYRDPIKCRLNHKLCSKRRVFLSSACSNLECTPGAMGTSVICSTCYHWHGSMS